MPSPSRLLLACILCLCSVAASAGQPDGLDIPSTALVVTSINKARMVPGDDGKTHVEYDLLVTNAFTAPVTLSAIDVTGPDGTVLMHLTGPALAAATQTILDQKPVSAIPAPGAVAVEVDLFLPPGVVLRRLSHRIAYTIPADAQHTAILGSRAVVGPDVDVVAVPAVTIRPPLLGAGWAVINGCCTPNAHRNVRVAAGTRIGTPETFAIDYVRVDGKSFFRGDGKANSQYPDFGAEIHSVAAGVVVAVYDGMEESVPFQPATTVHAPLDFGGNFVIVRIAQGVYAFYAHLQKGSVAVVVGGKVRVGAVVGRLGSSGNSTNPHLHFGLLDRPDFLTGYSLPFIFDDEMLTGRITGADDNGFQIAPAAQRVHAAYPLVGGIATYK